MALLQNLRLNWTTLYDFASNNENKKQANPYTVREILAGQIKLGIMNGQLSWVIRIIQMHLEQSQSSLKLEAVRTKYGR